MSGQQIGTGVGFIAGFFLPGGPQVWAGIGGLIGGAISPTQIEGPRLTDGMGVTAQEGVPNPWGFGSFSTGVNVLNAFDLREVREEDDGKGSGTEQVTYRYTRSFALGVCRAVRNADGTYSDIAGVLRVTHNGKDVYNVLPDATEDQRANNAKFLEQYKIYLGGEDQMPDPTLVAYLGTANASAYRGQVYIVGTDIDLTDARGALGSWEVVVAMQGETTGTQWVIGGATGATIKIQPSDGDTFMETPYTQFAIGSFLIANATRMLNYGGDNLSYSDDGAETMTLVPDWGVLGGLYKGQWANGKFWIPRGTLGYATSPDGVNDWIQYPLDVGAGLQVIAGTGSVMIAAGNPQGPTPAVNTRCSTNSGISWSSEFSGLKRRGSASSAGTTAGGSDGEIIVLGGETHALAWTANGSTFFQISSPFSDDGTGGNSTRYIGRIVPGYDKYGERLWIATSRRNDGGTHGETAWSRDGKNWNLLEFGAFGIDILDCDYGARKFIAVSGSGTIKVLDDVEVGWVSQSNAWNPTDTIHAVAALLEPITTTPGAIPLADIATEVCRRSGLSDSDIDTSRLTGETKGFKVATETTAEAIFNSLRPAYQFDVAEWDDKIRFVTRGGAPAFHLTVDDLVERDGPLIEETAVQEVELLRKVIVHAMDPTAGYVETTQSWERRAATVAASGEQTVRIPCVMDPDEQRQVAQKRVKVGWTEIRRFAMDLPFTRPELTPTDCGTVTDRSGRVQGIRLEDMTEDGGVIQIREARLYRQSAYVSNAVGVSHGQRPTTTPQPAGPTFFAAMNLPSLRTSDNVPGMYLAAAGYQRGWHGASIWLSTDGGASFQRILEWPTASRMGSLTADITDISEPIPVFMNSGTLSTITDDQLANRGNGFAITTDGVSEVGQFKTATLTGTQAYDATDTVRGGLGTAAAAHATGDPFVMLSSVQFLPIDISSAGKTLIFKAVSYGETLDETAEYPVVFSPLFTSVSIESYVDEDIEEYVDENGLTYITEVTT